MNVSVLRCLVEKYTARPSINGTVGVREAFDVLSITKDKKCSHKNKTELKLLPCNFKCQPINLLIN